MTRAGGVDDDGIELEIATGAGRDVDRVGWVELDCACVL